MFNAKNPLNLEISVTLKYPRKSYCTVLLYFENYLPFVFSLFLLTIRKDHFVYHLKLIYFRFDKMIPAFFPLVIDVIN